MAVVVAAGFPSARQDHTDSAGSSQGWRSVDLARGYLFLYRGGIFLIEAATIIDTVPCSYADCNPLGDTRPGTSMILYTIAGFEQNNLQHYIL